jgi:cyclohexanecarboxylate-CoA ligase
VLLEHPAVAEVAIVAMPDPILGERACAFVVAGAGGAPTLPELTGFLRARGLAMQKLPERLEIVGELPQTASGKVQKFRLREEVARLVQMEPA